MGDLYLVRHGQANSAATSEAEYDQLSELGHVQAGFLGAWVRGHLEPFDHVFAGTMRRHRETAIAMGFEAERHDARVNELNYFELADDMQRVHGLTPPRTSEDFAVHMPQTFCAWQRGEVRGEEEFAAFESRIRDGMMQAALPGKRTLCVTSGGVIAMTMRLALGIGPAEMAQILLPVWNSSLHHFRVSEAGLHLVSFNMIPHLRAPERAQDRTYF